MSHAHNDEWEKIIEGIELPNQERIRMLFRNIGSGYYQTSRDERKKKK